MEVVTATSTLTGKVVLRESGVGIPDLLVVVCNLDPGAPPNDLFSGSAAPAGAPPFGQRVGSVLTDRDGAWTRRYRHPGAASSDAAAKPSTPNLCLLVLAPEDSDGSEPMVLHKSPLVPQKAREIESYLIQLNLLPNAEIPSPTRQRSAANIDAKVTRYRDEQDLQARFSKGLADYHKTQAGAELQGRKRFKQDFIRRIATDFDKVRTSGVLVADDGDVRTPMTRWSPPASADSPSKRSSRVR